MRSSIHKQGKLSSHIYSYKSFIFVYTKQMTASKHILVVAGWFPPILGIFNHRFWLQMTKDRSCHFYEDIMSPLLLITDCKVLTLNVLYFNPLISVSGMFYFNCMSDQQRAPKTISAVRLLTLDLPQLMSLLPEDKKKILSSSYS